jgi:hypothetical protein
MLSAAATGIVTVKQCSLSFPMIQHTQTPEVICTVATSLGYCRHLCAGFSATHNLWRLHYICLLLLACLQVLAQQGRARTATMKLPHYTAETPMFMPVGTQGKKQCLQVDKQYGQLHAKLQ